MLLSVCKVYAFNLVWKFAPYSGGAKYCSNSASYLFEDSNNCPCSSTNYEHGRRKERIEPLVIKRVETDIEISDIVAFREIKLVFLSLKDRKSEHADPLQT